MNHTTNIRRCRIILLCLDDKDVTSSNSTQTRILHDNFITINLKTTSKTHKLRRNWTHEHYMTDVCNKSIDRQEHEIWTTKFTIYRRDSAIFSTQQQS